jgi:hypothetical protein
MSPFDAEQYRKTVLERDSLREQRNALLAALKAVVADVLDYEMINNLAPNPGRQFCWDSVARADAAIKLCEKP